MGYKTDIMEGWIVHNDVAQKLWQTDILLIPVDVYWWRSRQRLIVYCICGWERYQIWVYGGYWVCTTG